MLLSGRQTLAWFLGLLTFMSESMNALNSKSMSRWHCCQLKWTDSWSRWCAQTGESRHCPFIEWDRFTAMRALSFQKSGYEWFLQPNENDPCQASLNYYWARVESDRVAPSFDEIVDISVVSTMIANIITSAPISTIQVEIALSHTSKLSFLLIHGFLHVSCANTFESILLPFPPRFPRRREADHFPFRIHFISLRELLCLLFVSNESAREIIYIYW
jgi:hypothetical protein